MGKRLEKQLEFEFMEEIKQEEKRGGVVKTMYLTSIGFSAGILITTIVSAAAFEVGHWSARYLEYIEVTKEFIKYLFQ